MPNNIIKSYEYDDLISFKIECDCCEHDLIVVLIGDEFNEISLILQDHSLIKTDEYGLTLCSRFWGRIKKAFAILFTGLYSNDYTFVFKGEEQLNEFVEYLSVKKNKILMHNKNEKNKSQ